MEAAGAGEVFRGVYEGSISGSELDVERRPYHKYCSCPLHAFGSAKCPHRNHPTISYPIRRSWSEGSLALYASASASASASSSPSNHVSRPHLPLPLPLPSNVSSINCRNEIPDPI